MKFQSYSFFQATGSGRFQDSSTSTGSGTSSTPLCHLVQAVKCFTLLFLATILLPGMSILNLAPGMSTLKAQTLLWDLDSKPGIYLPIYGFPKSELPKGADSVAFHYDEETYSLGFMVFKSDGAYLIESYEGEDVWFNWAKANEYGTYEEGKVQFCSQLPWKAAIACDIFTWDGKTFHYKETDIEDPSEEKTTEAYELREADQPCKALQVYNTVEYPYSYFNPDYLFAELFMEAHEVALKKYREKDYQGAVNEIQCILEESWVTIPDDYLNEEGHLNEHTSLSYTNYVAVMGDYGLFLVRAKKFEEAVAVNGDLVKFAPEVVGPRLQLGDALFELGRQEEAKTAYREYQSSMTKAGKEDQIPSRVRERTR